MPGIQKILPDIQEEKHEDYRPSGIPGTDNNTVRKWWMEYFAREL